MIRVAIIGAGTYAGVHADALRADPRAEARWVWSRTPAKRQAFAKRFGMRAAEDWRACIEDPVVDAVHVVTPDSTHTQYVLAALAAGKHVLVEKPIATTIVECEQMIAARDAARKKLMVNYHNRWYPAYKRAREAVVTGEIGVPVCGTFVMSDTITWTESSMMWADKSGPDIFVDQTGDPAIIDASLDQLCGKGTLFIYAYIGEPIPFHFGRLQLREIKILTCTGSPGKTMEHAAKWIAEDRIPLEPLITHEYEAGDAVAAFQDIENKDQRHVKSLIRFGE